MYNVILLLHSVASTHNSDVVNRLVRKVKAGRQVSYSEEQITSKYFDFIFPSSATFVNEIYCNSQPMGYSKLVF